jgi:RNA polymerase sigma-70 factor (ECF subfamily)
MTSLRRQRKSFVGRATLAAGRDIYRSMTISDPAETPRTRLERLVGEHGAAVRAYAARRTTADGVDDVVAETFAVAWRRIGDVPPGAELPWLLGVARRVLANAHRADDRRDRLAERLAAWTPRTPAADLDLVDGDRVRAALAALSDGDRDLLLLVEVDGLARDDAAVALGVSRALVRVRLHRARRRFATAFAAATDVSTHPRAIEVPRVAR